MSLNPAVTSVNTLIQSVELSDLRHQPGAEPPLMPQKLDVFAGVKAHVSVLAGTVQANIGELLSLKEGAVLQLDRVVNAPFDVVLDGHLLARGELVAVGDYFGVRISEVCAPLQR
jgi:flagellar motor switch protein FliN/FliY